MYSLDRERLFIGAPIPLADICLVHPLTAFEVFNITQIKYNYYLNLLTLGEEDLEEIFESKKIPYDSNNLSPFNYLLDSCANDGNFLLEIKKAFFTFIREKVQILPDEKIIIIGSLKEKRFITENNFKEFQDILRIQNGIEIEEEEEIPEDENPMQKKFRLRRKQLKKAKKKQAQKKAKEGQSIDFYSIVKALIVKKVIDYKDLKELSTYAIRELFDVLQAEEEYNNQIKYLCAGADPKKVKLEYWIKKSYEK